MSVNSRDNKALLWQLLSDHPFLKKDPKKFQSVLEYRVNEIHKNRFHFNNNLMTMNKEIIKQFANEINNQTQPKPLPKMTKTQAFDKKLKEQEDNFSTLINKQKPPDIDFSDKNEEEPVTNRMVDNTLLQREQELKNIMAQYDNENDATTWLKPTETSSAKNLKIDKTSNIKLQPTIIENEPKQPEKRVRFEISEKKTNFSASSTLFINKLKKLDKKEEITDYLKRIEDKQDKIIALLERKN